MITMKAVDFALSQKNSIDQLELVGTILWNKAKLVTHFSCLSQAERHFVYIDIFESELNHGGLFSFYFNNSGAYAHEVLTAFEAVKAFESAHIFYKSLRVFSDLPVPKDIFLRRQNINELSEYSKNKWLELEQDFINTSENLVELILDYVKKNKSYFEY